MAWLRLPGAPLATRRRAAAGMASAGSMMLPPSPNSAQVEGSNCIGPSAPALEGPSSAPKPDSSKPIAARTGQGMP